MEMRAPTRTPLIVSVTAKNMPDDFFSKKRAKYGRIIEHDPKPIPIVRSSGNANHNWLRSGVKMSAMPNVMQPYDMPSNIVA